ncbi:MAG TPA: class I SAM-dependent methyltransferase [Anaeromyxobacteraceae bacterium]|nr:class I SAM-dependent methyltransferase [Anaeromyxobacteraceae bacterium]
MPGVDRTPWLYDAVMAAMEWRGLWRWRRWLAGGARGRALDLGCGTGRNLPLLPAGVRAVAVDPFPQNLRAARRRAPRVPLVRARAESLPFRTGAFDTVVSGLVFCSVSDPALALAEARRVLAPRGALRMLEHVRSRNRVWGRVQDLYQPAWTWVAGGCHPNRETERSVEAAGFAIEPDGRRERGTLRRFQARPRP